MGCAASCSAASDRKIGEWKPSFYRHYQLGELLGQGAYGSVYKAVGRRHTRAVKVQSIRNPRRHRVECEANIWHHACSKSEHIVRLEKVYQEADVYFMVMELCHCSVYGRLMSNPRWTYVDLLQDFEQILYGVAHLHSMRIFHGDIKAENIMYGGTNGDTLKITDFGLSTVLRHNEYLTARQGTRVYMAPELLGDDVRYSLPADMWSVGVLFFIIFVGVYPIAENCKNFEEFKEEMDEMPDEPRICKRLAEKLQMAISRCKAKSRNATGSTPCAMRLNIMLLERRLLLLQLIRKFLKRDPSLRAPAYRALDSDMFIEPGIIGHIVAFREVSSLLVVDRSTGEAHQETEPKVEKSREKTKKEVMVERCQHACNELHAPDEEVAANESADQNRPLLDSKNSDECPSGDTKNILPGGVEREKSDTGSISQPLGVEREKSDTGSISQPLGVEREKSDNGSSSQPLGSDLGRMLSSGDRGMKLENPFAQHADDADDASLLSILERRINLPFPQHVDDVKSEGSDVNDDRPGRPVHFGSMRPSSSKRTNQVRPPDEEPFFLITPGQQPDDRDEEQDVQD
eukprot:TRINITY_DN3541_c0_g1_i1.p1 TRINITY_DN3541_c0_g1~~TRINITY_DN3541_c0_g1_i1.p1  ORF type:complete len:573 (-),score=88.71 TRINITY_DN3541_c0_g1_i1:150-1868(-)